MSDAPGTNEKYAPPPKRRWRVFASRLVLGLVLYVGSYAALSFTGGWVVSESGEVRLIMAVADTFQWQPRHGRCERFRQVDGDYTLRADAVGYFFAPLILLDQRFVHPTIRFITTDGRMLEPLPVPPLSEYHPIHANRWQGRFPYEEPGNAP